MVGVVQRQSVKGDVLREPSIPEVPKYRRQDAEFLGFIRRSGWSGERPYYRFRCFVHGLVEDYPHGYNCIMECPHCD